MLSNLFLMLAWAALWNDFSFRNLLIGFLVGYLVLAVFAARGVYGPTRYVVRSRRTLSFLGFYAYELVLSNIRIAVEVLVPRLRTRPGVVAIPLDPRLNTNAEITLLANLISLTPGTLTLDVSEDRKTLYVHAMDIPDEDVETFRAKIKHDLERRVLEVLH